MQAQSLDLGAVDPAASAPPETIVVPRSRDLGGGFEVRRVLPAIERRMVGPFVFFDQMGPIVLHGEQALDVRPHPHIGLATVTYLFSGAVLHRDSLGSVARIEPGAVNWMVAGGGIVHSERTPQELRKAGSDLFGIQLWVGLPREHEEAEPSFTHVDAGDLPLLEGEGVTLRVILGEAYGAKAPVPVFSPMFYADAALAPGAKLALPGAQAERAVYIAEGAVEMAGSRFESGRLMVFPAHADIALKALGRARLLLLGGEPLDGPRHLWWNFVASSQDRIERAKADWRAGRFAPVPGETEWIPLPEK
ncbi:MAG: pirin family protein [Stellaceae bacterium]